MFFKGRSLTFLNCYGAVICTLFQVNVSALNLTVIHNNDFHTRFVPMKSRNYAECELNNATECIGGVARTVAEVRI